MRTSSAIFCQQIQKYQRDLHQVKSSVLYTYTTISKERDIGQGQCVRIVNALCLAEEPLCKLSELLDTSESLPLFAQSTRHSLLIVLDATKNLLHSLLDNIGSLHHIYSKCSAYEASKYREQILYQMKAFEQKREAIIQDMDRLL